MICDTVILIYDTVALASYVFTSASQKMFVLDLTLSGLGLILFWPHQQACLLENVFEMSFLSAPLYVSKRGAY